MKAHRRFLGILTMTQTAAVAILVIAALLGSGGQASADHKFKLIYVDMHMHSTHSDGSGSVAKIKETALERELSAVIVTDHCKYLTRDTWKSLVEETEEASDGSFLALAGFEVTGSDGMFNRDHINAIDVRDPFVGRNSDELCPEEVWESPPNSAGTGPLHPENLTKWVDYIHSKGGIAVHNHPTGSTLLDYGVNNIEVYNQSHVDDIAGYAKQLGYSDEEAWGFGITINNFAVYGERDTNIPVSFPGYDDPIPLREALYYGTLVLSGVGQWLGSPNAPLNSWDDLLMAYVHGDVDTPIFGLANSDAHNTGDSDSNVGIAKNGAYVKELTARELYKAIKAGRTFATTGPSLALDVNGEMMGDTACISDGKADVNLSMNSDSETAILVKIDIIKNGEIWQTVGDSLPTYMASMTDDDVTEDGYYRVEVTSYDVISGSLYFAWSNPVFVSVRCIEEN